MSESRATPEHRCPACGYDRSGIPSAVCPECGTRRPTLHSLVSTLDSAIGAFSDPTFYQLNDLEDLSWQIEEYSTRLQFLVRDHGFVFKRYRPRLEDALRNHVVFRLCKPRCRVTLWVSDRDRYLILDVGMRATMFWRTIEALGLWRHCRETPAIVTDPEALAIGTHSARSLHIERVAELFRVDLAPVWSGNFTILEAARRAERERWRQFRWQDDEELDKRIDAARRRTASANEVRTDVGDR